MRKGQGNINLLVHKKKIMGIFWAWDSIFGKGYGLDGQGIVVLLPAVSRSFSPLKRPDRSTAHPAFYSLGNDGRHGREADDRPLSSVSTPMRLHGAHKEKFAWKCYGYALCWPVHFKERKKSNESPCCLNASPNLNNLTDFHNIPMNATPSRTTQWKITLPMWTGIWVLGTE